MFDKPSYYEVAARQERLSRRIVQPSSKMNLARVLAHRSPTISAERAMDNAEAIIKALHRLGYDVVPILLWETGQLERPRRTELNDAFTAAAMLIQEADDTGRKPWIPDSEY